MPPSFKRLHPTMRYIGTAQYLVLKVLVRCGSVHGVDIPAKAKELYNADLSVSNVYTTLKKLQNKGLIESVIEDPSPMASRRERRKIYLLTPLAEPWVIEEAWRRDHEVLVPRVRPEFPADGSRSRRWI